MKRNYRICILIALVLSIYISGCAPKVLVTSTIGTIDSRNRLLVATQKSEFKDAVAGDLVKRLEKEDFYIKVIDVANLSEISSREYRAIVIMADYKFFSMNSKVKGFLKTLGDSEREKIVLLTTAGSPQRVSEIPGVDAITSASSQKNADTVSTDIFNRVNSVLSKR